MKARFLLTVVILATSSLLGCVMPGVTPTPQPTQVPACDTQYPKAAIPLADRQRVITLRALSNLENLDFEAINKDVEEFEVLIIEVEDLKAPALYGQYHRLWLNSLNTFNESLKAVVEGEAQIASDKFAQASQAAEEMVDELDRIDKFCRNKIGQDA